MSTMLQVAGVHVAVILVALLVGYVTYGRERPSHPPPPEDRPNDLSPAEVAALDAEGRVTSRAWIATLIELLSREVIIGGRVVGVDEDHTEHERFGLQRVDTARSLRRHERAVVRVIGALLANGPVARVDLAAHLGKLGEVAVREGREFVVTVRGRLYESRLTIVDGTAFAWSVVAGATVAAAATLLALEAFSRAAPATVRNIGLGLAVGTVVGSGAAWVVAGWKRLWVGRSEAGGRAAALWRAYGAGLLAADKGEAGSLLVERLSSADLAYAVALGVAPEVEAAWLGSVPSGIPLVEPVAVP